MTSKIVKIPFILIFFLLAISIYFPRIFIEKLIAKTSRNVIRERLLFKNHVKRVAELLEEQKEHKPFRETKGSSLINSLLAYRDARRDFFGGKVKRRALTAYADIKFTLNSNFYNIFLRSLPLMPLGKFKDRFTVIERWDDPYIFPRPFVNEAQNAGDLERQIFFFNRVAHEFPGYNIFIYNILLPEFSNIHNELINSNQLNIDAKNVLVRFLNKLSPKINYFSLQYDFKEYKDYFYKTDHHWNISGAHKAYSDIINMIEKKVPAIGKPLEPLERQRAGNIEFRGTFSRSASFLKQKDEIWGYKFKLPSYKVYLNGNIPLPRNDRELVLRDKGEKDVFTNYYVEYYGNDYGLIRYESKENSRNILIFVDSFASCMENLFTAHYSNVYIVDLSYYEDDLGEKFKLKEFLKEHKVDDILFLLNTDRLLFGQKEYKFTDILEP